MLRDFINELNAIQEENEILKEEIKNLKADKKRMSEALYEHALKEYAALSKEERVKQHIEQWCKNCRAQELGEECPLIKELPDNIMEPKKSEKDFFPGHVVCKEFEWS